MAASIAQLQQTADPHGFLELMVIDHASFTSPVRIVNDTRNWTINGDVYVALPFSIKLPNQAQAENPRAQIRIDNVGRELTAAIGGLPVGASLVATLQMVSRLLPSQIYLDGQLAGQVGATPFFMDSTDFVLTGAGDQILVKPDYEFVAQLSNIHITPTMVSANMGPDDSMRQTAVRIRFDPANAPGLFAG